MSRTHGNQKTRGMEIMALLETVKSEQIRALLIKNWMTHDALWYSEMAGKFGMGTRKR